jgi:5'-deoxynucleotidase YfbR-like HD superfamily hydrolase
MARNDNNWIQTFTGRQFWPLDPRPEDIELLDIAHALANKCRYTGHTRSFYSVAQHSVLVSEIVPAADAHWGLLHDASEAYLPDVARPVKRELAGFQEIENRLMGCVAERDGGAA